MQVEVQNRQVLLKRDGKELAAVIINADQKEPVVDFKPELGSLFGPGTRYTWQVKPQDGLEGEIWLSAFPSGDFVFIGGSLKATGNKPVYVSNFNPCVIRMLQERFGNARVFLNSGAQWFAGSVSVTDPRAIEDECCEITAVQGEVREDCLGVGLVSLRRTLAYIGRSIEDGEFCIRPRLYYGGVRLDPGEDLRLETLMINTSPRGAGICLEEWADACVTVIKPKFNRTTVHGCYNNWYAYWTADNSHSGEGLALKGADDVEMAGLMYYGISDVCAGIQQNKSAFGEHKLWPGMFPNGLVGVAEKLAARGMGLTGGGFYGLVSECATVFQEHQEWMVRDEHGNPKRFDDVSWGACPSPCYAMDFTIPEAVEWLRTEVLEEQAKFGCKNFLLDFFSNAEGRAEGWFRQDEKVLAPIESLRLLPRMAREVLGEDCIIGTYTSPTNALVGLVDRVRMAADCGALEPRSDTSAASLDGGMGNILSQETIDKRWAWVARVARDMAGAYIYHDKFWINDPDPAMVGLTDNPATLEEARVRLMICADSGGFPTIGEAVRHQSPARLALLKKWLPSHGKAARPVDLMTTEFPSIRHLRFDHSAGAYDVLSLYNWENEPRTFTVDLDDLGLSGNYHVFEFWDQEYEGTASRKLEFTVPARAVRVVRLSLVTNIPQVIGTDRHVSMGIKELPQIAWSDSDITLSGVALRPLPEDGCITVAVPNGWKVESSEGLEIKTTGEVLTAAVKFNPDGNPWRIKFSRANNGKP